MGRATELGRVRGLGSAREGTHHWIVQRLTAIGNLLLFPWLIVSLVMLPDYSHGTVSAWLSSMWVAIPLLLLIVNVFYHIRIGLQVLIEDYAHAEMRIVLFVLLNAFVFIAAAVATFSILRIAFGAAA